MRLFDTVALVLAAAALALQPVGAEPTPLPTERIAGSEQPKDNRDDALDEVNAKRATRGLHPYTRDEGLTVAARAAAKYRAERHMFGHAMDQPMGDFRFVPKGTTAVSAGCAAYPASYGWMSCDIWEPNRYGGAAWYPGTDGKRYMHLYIR